MHRLPFNPEPLLAFFMTNENAGSLAGDLHERYQRTCERHGHVGATLQFLWELLVSLPSIVQGALMTTLNRSRFPAEAMVGIEVFAVRNQAVRIVNFPHQWNQFTLVGFEGGRALLNKWSNHQRFTVPIQNIVSVNSDLQGNNLDWALTCEVRWRTDGTNCGSFWNS